MNASIAIRKYVFLPTLTVAQWRNKYGDLLEPVTFPEIWGRADEPDFDELRPLVDDVAGVMGQVKIARDSGNLRVVPAWMNNEAAVRELLLAHFPRLATYSPFLVDEEQKRTAAKWYFIITRFRTLASAADIAREWNEMFQPSSALDATHVRSTVQKILFVAAGLRTDGKARSGKRGRPKKKL